MLGAFLVAWQVRSVESFLEDNCRRTRTKVVVPAPQGLECAVSEDCFALHGKKRGRKLEKEELDNPALAKGADSESCSGKSEVSNHPASGDDFDGEEGAGELDKPEMLEPDLPRADGGLQDPDEVQRSVEERASAAGPACAAQDRNAKGWNLTDGSLGQDSRINPPGFDWASTNVVPPSDFAMLESRRKQ